MMVATLNRSTEVKFENPIDDTQCEIMYDAIEAEIGQSDHYDRCWTVLYGPADSNGNNIVGIRVVDPEFESAVLAGVDTMVALYDGQWS